jgi:hypothetical protein
MEFSSSSSEFLQKSVIQNGFIKNVESKNLILGENSFQNQNSAKYQKHILLQTLQEKPLERFYYIDSKHHYI